MNILNIKRIIWKKNNKINWEIYWIDFIGPNILNFLCNEIQFYLTSYVSIHLFLSKFWDIA